MAYLEDRIQALIEEMPRRPRTRSAGGWSKRFPGERTVLSRSSTRTRATTAASRSRPTPTLSQYAGNRGTGPAFNRLAPNMIVKIPVTRAGIPAIEEATYQGVSINATVSFTLPQCDGRGRGDGARITPT